MLRNFRSSDDHIVERRAAFQKLAAEGPQIRKIPGNEALRVKDFDILARDGHRILVCRSAALSPLSSMFECVSESQKLLKA